MRITEAHLENARRRNLERLAKALGVAVPRWRSARARRRLERRLFAELEAMAIFDALARALQPKPPCRPTLSSGGETSVAATAPPAK